MNCICKKHDPPFRWSFPDGDVPPIVVEALMMCGCGERGELDVDLPKPVKNKTDLQMACSLLERWYGSPTQDPHLSKDTYDFLVGISQT